MASLLSVAVVGQIVGILFGDCGWVYYYAAIGGLALGWGIVGAIYMMWWIQQEPIRLAHLAFQMRREVHDGDYCEEIRAHYSHLADVVEAVAEKAEPGVLRRAWTERESAAKSREQNNV